MISKIRDTAASDILTIINEEVNKLSGLSNGELFNTAKQNYHLLIRIDEPGFLDSIASRDLNDAQMNMIKNGTVRDSMLMFNAAIVLASQVNRPEALHDLVSSLYGVDLYPQLAILGKTGVFPGPVAASVPAPVPAAFEGGPA